MMVSSTGADSASQAGYLGQVLTDLPSQYPSIKALIYFDAPDTASGDQYQLVDSRVGLARISDGLPVLQSRSSANRHVGLVVAGLGPNGSGRDAECFGQRRRQQREPDVSGQRCGDRGLRLSSDQDAADLHDATVQCRGPEHRRPLRRGLRLRAVDLGADHRDGWQGQSLAGSHPDLPWRPTAEPTTTSAPGSPLAAPVSPTVGGPTPASGAVPVPAAGSAYLGAFVDPSGSSLLGDPTGGIASLPSELAALPTINGTLERPLSIVPVYLNWRDCNHGHGTRPGGRHGWHSDDHLELRRSRRMPDVANGANDGRIDQLAAVLDAVPASRLPSLVPGPERRHQHRAVWAAVVQPAMWRPTNTFTTG